LWTGIFKDRIIENLLSHGNQQNWKLNPILKEFRGLINRSNGN